MTADWQLAQLNIARPRAALDDPLMAEFMANLERINGLGDASPGFVWRLQGESGDATGLEQPFGADIIVNMTVWADLASLRAFALRDRRGACAAVRSRWGAGWTAFGSWWVPAGHRPYLAEAKARLDLLAADGPTAEGNSRSRALARPPARPSAVTSARGVQTASQIKIGFGIAPQRLEPVGGRLLVLDDPVVDRVDERRRPGRSPARVRRGPTLVSACTAAATSP